MIQGHESDFEHPPVVTGQYPYQEGHPRCDDEPDGQMVIGVFWAIVLIAVIGVVLASLLGA